MVTMKIRNREAKAYFDEKIKRLHIEESKLYFVPSYATLEPMAPIPMICMLSLTWFIGSKYSNDLLRFIYLTPIVSVS